MVERERTPQEDEPLHQKSRPGKLSALSPDCLEGIAVQEATDQTPIVALLEGPTMDLLVPQGGARCLSTRDCGGLQPTQKTPETETTANAIYPNSAFTSACRLL